MSLARWAGGTGGGCFFEDVKCIKNRDSHALRFSASLSCTAETSRACAASPRALRAHESRLRVGRPCHSPERETTRERRGGAVLRSRVQPRARRSATRLLGGAPAQLSPLERRANLRGRARVRGHARGVRGLARARPRGRPPGTRRRAVRQAPGDRGGRTEPFRAFPPRRAFSSGRLFPRARGKASRDPANRATREPARPTRLRVAMSAPAQTLPAAAVMDCLHFENKTPPGRAGATGAARRRSAVPRGRRPRGAQSRVRLLPGRAQEPAAQETQRRERRIRREGRGR